jgi:carbamoyltransferase
MIILGLSAYHGDASAVLLRDGELLAAVEEERFRRVKHWAGFPRESIRVCLEMAGIGSAEVDHFAISRRPRAHVLRKAAFAVRHRPGLRLMRDRVTNAGRVQGVADWIGEATGLDTKHVKGRTHWIEHHPAHLASAFFLSAFDEAAVCAIDGFGDFVSTSRAVGSGSRLRVLDRVYFPHSIGLMYLAITQYLGFSRYGDEYKVMGLAPYGAPDYVESLRRLIRLRPEGTFELDLSYFRHWSEGVRMTWDDGEPVIGTAYTPRLEELVGPARKPGDRLEPRHEAVAASLQVVFEEAVFHVLNALHRRTRLVRLCLAGGCAMNSVANGKVLERTPFETLYVQPAAADNGTALGAAFYVWNHVLGRPRGFVMDHGYWGPAFTDQQIRIALDAQRRELARLGCEIWPRAGSSGGFRAGWSGGRVPWVTAASWRILGAATCAISSTPRSSSARSFDRSLLRFWRRRSTSTSWGPCPTHS